MHTSHWNEKHFAAYPFNYVQFFECSSQRTTEERNNKCNAENVIQTRMSQFYSIKIVCSIIIRLSSQLVVPDIKISSRIFARTLLLIFLGVRE